jgi:hypothetical protein
MTERAAGEPKPAAPAQDAPAARSIVRRDFEQVIRRAAELSLSDTDPDDNLSEDEVLRIAKELGLPAHHVRQALFELPDLKVRPQWYDRYFGPAVFSVNRVVPTRKEQALRRVEDYLVTREYLQIVRRKGDTIAFVPADDTISSLARAEVVAAVAPILERAAIYSVPARENLCRRDHYSRVDQQHRRSGNPLAADQLQALPRPLAARGQAE